MDISEHTKPKPDETFEVYGATYHVHHKSGKHDAPTTMRVEYSTSGGPKKEWVCFNHAGFARERAVTWWERRSMVPAPGTTEAAVFLAERGALATPVEIAITSDDGWDRISRCRLGDVPDYKGSLPVLRTPQPLTGGSDPFTRSVMETFDGEEIQPETKTLYQQLTDDEIPF